MSVFTQILSAWGIAEIWLYCGLFVSSSLLMLWRLDALLKQGLEGTALGTIVMPYCSGLGNLLFVAIVSSKPAQTGEVLTNCLVNNVTNLTVVLGLPAIFWGLQFRAANPGRSRANKVRQQKAKSERTLSRLSLLLTLAAVVFFSGATWALGRDGQLDRSDGLVLIGLFLFWQCFQLFEVTRQNVRQRQTFRGMFYLDVAIVLVGAYGQYVSLDWIVAWLGKQHGTFINGEHLGWLTGWLMVVPNALLAVYYAGKKRADIAYASQVGDGHICIPLCVGLAAVIQPLAIPQFFQTGLLLLIAAAVVHMLCVAAADGLPRWMGWPLSAAYAWFLIAGLANS